MTSNQPSHCAYTIELWMVSRDPYGTVYGASNMEKGRYELNAPAECPQRDSLQTCLSVHINSPLYALCNIYNPHGIVNSRLFLHKERLNRKNTQMNDSNE